MPVAIQTPCLSFHARKCHRLLAACVGSPAEEAGQPAGMLLTNTWLHEDWELPAVPGLM